MSDAPLMLGVSGLRGIAGKSLTPELAVRYAGAFGTWLRELAEGRALDGAYAVAEGSVAPVVAVARDGRVGGEVYYHAAIAGLLGAGCDVIPLGVCPTPAIGALVGRCAGAGIMVTASHNPQEWNGLKCFVSSGSEIEDDRAELRGGRAPSPKEAAEIVAAFQRGRAVWHAPDPSGARSKLHPPGEASEFLRAVLQAPLHELLPEHLRAERLHLGFHCVVDAVNSSGSKISVPFLEHVGRCTPLFCSGSGVFPHTPEPTEENLSGAGGGVGLTQAVPGLGADVGFAQDPDADRLAIVDERGRYIGEEYTLVLAALALLEAEGIEGGAGGRPVVVVNLSTSRMIEDVCARYGAEVVRTPVGEANVVAAMERLAREGRRVLMGGEGNGGVIWPEVSLVRDSLAAIALTLALMARTGKKVSELVEWVNSMSGSGRGYAIVKQKAALARKEDARPGLERIAGAYGGAEEGERARRHEGTRWGTVVIDRQDGVRIDFLDRFESGAAWVHVRASNTEPILRVIAEAGRREDAEALAREVGELAGA